MDGGFRGRGLGALTTTQMLSASEHFATAIAPIYQARAQFLAASAHQGLTAADVHTISEAFNAFDQRVQQHFHALDQVQSEAQLAEWTSTGDSIVAEARPVAARVAPYIVEEAALRPWKIGLAVAGVGAAIGFIWLVSR